MIRLRTDTGAIAIGMVKGPWLDALLAGHRVCVPRHIDGNGVEHPHLCLFMADTNDELLAKADDLFPGGLMPGAISEQVTTEEPKP